MPSDQNKKSRSKQPKPVPLKLTDENILTVLLGRELYGLDISAQLNNSDRPFENLKLGSLYAALNRLEKKGLVSCRWGDEVEGASKGARRKYYKVTGLGEQSLCAVQQYRASLSLRPQGGLGVMGAVGYGW